MVAARSISPVTVTGIEVLDDTPIPGAAIGRDQVPANVTVIGDPEFDRMGIASLTAAILEVVPSATINDTEGKPFQPDILVRGFTASPVAGTPEGLAIYVNGARFNDAFGDTVNWDLIPQRAIKTAQKNLDSLPCRQSPYGRAAQNSRVH